MAGPDYGDQDDEEMHEPTDENEDEVTSDQFAPLAGWPTLDKARVSLRPPRKAIDNFGRSSKDKHLSIGPAWHNTKIRRRARYLASSRNWKNKVGKGWEPKEVIGQGGFGLVSLFEWKGTGEGTHRWEEKVKYVVVKQGLAGGDLRREAQLGRLFRSHGSKHFVRVYRRVYRDVGSGLSNIKVDQAKREVNRLFLEYCEGGDIHQTIMTLINTDKSISEVRAWSFLVCLAKAALVMETGFEDPDAGHDPRFIRPFVHFDLKPGNILVGRKDNAEHKDAAIAKTHDFGLSEQAIDDGLQGPHYIDRRATKGTLHYLAPEQSRYGWIRDDYSGQKVHAGDMEYSHRRYGRHTNVWGVGTVMWCLLMGKPNFPLASEIYKSELSERLRQGFTIGRTLEPGPAEANNHDYEINRKYREQKANLNWRAERRAQFGGYGWRGDIKQQFGNEVSWDPVDFRDEFGPTIPPKAEKPVFSFSPHSVGLKALVLECLMQEYWLRPEPKELLKRAEAGLEAALQNPALNREEEVDIRPSPEDVDIPTPADWVASLTPPGGWDNPLPEVQLAREKWYDEQKNLVHNARRERRFARRMRNFPTDSDSDMRRREWEYIQFGIKESLSDGEKARALALALGEGVVQEGVEDVPNWDQHQYDPVEVLPRPRKEDFERIHAQLKFFDFPPAPPVYTHPPQVVRSGWAPPVITLHLQIYRLDTSQYGPEELANKIRQRWKAPPNHGLSVSEITLDQIPTSTTLGEVNRILNQVLGLEFGTSNTRFSLLHGWLMLTEYRDDNLPVGNYRDDLPLHITLMALRFSPYRNGGQGDRGNRLAVFQRQKIMVARDPAFPRPQIATNVQPDPPPGAGNVAGPVGTQGLDASPWVPQPPAGTQTGQPPPQGRGGQPDQGARGSNFPRAGSAEAGTKRHSPDDFPDPPGKRHNQGDQENPGQRQHQQQPQRRRFGGNPPPPRVGPRGMHGNLQFRPYRPYQPAAPLQQQQPPPQQFPGGPNVLPDPAAAGPQARGGGWFVDNWNNVANPEGQQQQQQQAQQQQPQPLQYIPPHLRVLNEPPWPQQMQQQQADMQRLQQQQAQHAAQQQQLIQQQQAQQQAQQQPQQQPQQQAQQQAQQQPQQRVRQELYIPPYRPQQQAQEQQPQQQAQQQQAQQQQPQQRVRQELYIPPYRPQQQQAQQPPQEQAQQQPQQQPQQQAQPQAQRPAQQRVRQELYIPPYRRRAGDQAQAGPPQQPPPPPPQLADDEDVPMEEEQEFGRGGL